MSIDRKTCDYELYMEKEVVEEVEDPVLQISLEDAKKLYAGYGIGDTVRQEIKSKEFGRIATQNAKNVILQKDPRGGAQGSIRSVPYEGA